MPQGGGACLKDVVVGRPSGYLGKRRRSAPTLRPGPKPALPGSQNANTSPNYAEGGSLMAQVNQPALSRLGATDRFEHLDKPGAAGEAFRSVSARPAGQIRSQLSTKLRSA